MTECVCLCACVYCMHVCVWHAIMSVAYLTNTLVNIHYTLYVLGSELEKELQKEWSTDVPAHIEFIFNEGDRVSHSNVIVIREV